MRLEKLARIIHLDLLLEYIAAIQKDTLSYHQIACLEEEQGISHREYWAFVDYTMLNTKHSGSNTTDPREENWPSN